MKRVILSWFLLSAIILCSIGGIYYIHRYNSRIIPILDSLQASLERGDTDAALAQAEKLSMEWSSYHKVMRLVIRDDKLQSIDLSVAKIKPYINEDEKGEINAEIQVIKRYLTVLYESELPGWVNVL